MMSRRAAFVRLAALTLAPVLLAACGRKADNLRPPDSPYPRQYPAPRETSESDSVER
jgi:hypothetical protein